MNEIEKPLTFGFKVKVLHVLRIIVTTFVRFLFKLYYGEGEKIPQISDEILKQSAVEVARKIRNKEITSVEVLEACIRRIKETNSVLNYITEDRFKLALIEAKQADELIRSGSKTVDQLLKEKPFLGVPFTTKDSVGVKGQHQTAGVVLRKDVIAEEDADVVRLLRESGAIVIGLTNVPELCMWWESHNHIYGRTKNPYNTTRIVGGSSGGEGCIQAVGGSCFGIGTDIGGSIRMPAFFNGIFGHKPSKFVVSSEGQAPAIESELLMSFLGAGPMTRHAVDLMPILKVISGENSGKLKLDKPVDVSKLKIFYQIRNNAPLEDDVHPDIAKALQSVLAYFNTRYSIKAEEKNIEILKKTYLIWHTFMKMDIPLGSAVMKNYSFRKNCLEIFKNIIRCSDNILPVLLFALVYNTEMDKDQYNWALKIREELAKYFKDMLKDDGVFLYPTHPTPAPYHNETLLKPFNLSYTAVINCLGLPATHIPLGLSREGLPIGIQVVANHNNDRLCLAVAEELDKAFGGWKEP